MADIDFGQLSEALNDKSDRDLRNVDTTAKADAVIDFQLPTEENGYTWYRKYKSGWVEQGGLFGTGTASWANATITLPVAMADTNYTLWAQGNWSDATCSSCQVSQKTTTGATIQYANNTSTIQLSIWRVEGLSAN